MSAPRRSSSPGADSLAGSILLAHPSLQEPTFRRTVILMSSHDGEGAMGVVLNRPLGRRLGSLGGDFALGPLADVPLFDGGPVEKRQLILCAWRRQGDAGDQLQLLFGLDPEKLAEIVAAQPAGLIVRAYLGYAGWSGGQLEQELSRDTWVVGPVSPRVLEGPADTTLWRHALGSLDVSWRLLADEPDDPALN